MVMVAMDKRRDKKAMSRPVRVKRKEFDVVQQVQQVRCSVSIRLCLEGREQEFVLLKDVPYRDFGAAVDFALDPGKTPLSDSRRDAYAWTCLVIRSFSPFLIPIRHPCDNDICIPLLFVHPLAL